ncbi:28S ribosomal protein S29, mitochondrial [Anthonomus grandis grandis]|uniref:28S ribosomal protein S29, mitochondrial n=1 Tax=Anthonomus grandis grandis TaxID=2921223 RepID=UPI002166A153|nr:28S ribosomal protein S29, mitochondrial [Anthonomus grandis grandis]
MLKSTADFLIRFNSLRAIPCRLLSAATVSMSDQKLHSFRTQETDPLKHNSNHSSQFYTIPEQDKKVLFLHGGLPLSYEVQAKTFNELCVMVREPIIEIFDNLKHINYNKPAVRFVLYGKKGTGKSLSLAHALHYAYREKFLIVHVPWVGNWMRRSKDSSNSEITEGHIDLNIDAAAWLLHFKTQNAVLLQNPNLKISQDIVWTKRETTPKDSSLKELIEHGLNRIRFASRCVTILAQEIKRLSCEGHCKTFVAIDGFNAFFYPNTRVYNEKKEMVSPDKITITEGFLNLTKFDWTNSVIVVTVDEIAIAEVDQTSHYPRYLLGKKGFEHLDPFIPIEVKNFNEKEHHSIMNYYKERKWIQPYPGQDEELYFLSGANPYNLMNLCKSL